MIYKIVHFSEAVFPDTAVLQIQDELVEGETIYISKEHTLTIEHFIESGNTLTILDGAKILKLELAN